MKPRLAAIVTAVLVALACATVLAYAQTELSKLEGWKAYTPTRLEWLAVELNAGSRTQLTASNGYLVAFVPYEKTDTIVMFVRYTTNANRQAMNTTIDGARKVIQMIAERRGWDKWLKVREDVQAAE